MKLVKIGDIWVNKEHVTWVKRDDYGRTWIDTLGEGFHTVEVPVDEVAALLMGGDAAQKKLMSEEEQKAAWEKEKQEWETEMQKTLAYYRKKYGKD